MLIHAERRNYRRARRWLLLASIVGLLIAPIAARADIGVLLDEPTGLGAERYTSAGHAAVYLSNICAASPVRMRLCSPGEQGSVISNYPNFEEDHPYEWNIVPLSIFLYGKGEPGNEPLYASLPLKKEMEDYFRKTYFEPICTTAGCKDDKHAGWRDMVAATFNRDIYLFAAKTTPEQDRKIVAEFNERPNVNHYSIANTCADFAMRAINSIFPKAVHRDFINDFGMTSPKAIARSFTHYAEQHPNLGLYVVRYSQEPSTLRRSGTSRNGSEVAFRVKKWTLPLLYLNYHVVAALMIEYSLTARFNPRTELRKHPSAAITKLDAERKWAKVLGEPEQAAMLQRQIEVERDNVLGSERTWAAYKERFHSIVQDAVAEGVIHSPDDVRHLLSDFDQRGVPVLDGNGDAWLQVTSDGGDPRVGINRTNILSAGSDRRLAYRLMLGRIGFVLRSHTGHREPLAKFREDWSILGRLRASNPVQRTGRFSARASAISNPGLPATD